MSLAMITKFEYRNLQYEIQQVVPDDVKPSDDWHNARTKSAIQFMELEFDSTWLLHDQAENLAEKIQHEFGGLPTLVRVLKNADSSFAEGALAVLSPEFEPDISDMTGVDPVRGDEAHRWSHLMKGQ